MRQRKIEYSVDDNGCHNRVSHGVDRDGYVVVFRNKKLRRLHRLIYEQAHNVVLNASDIVRHLCHNRKCINIEHLEIGSQFDNIQDTVKANRHVFGEKVFMSKLKNNDVVSIRESLEKTTILAAKFNVSRVTISRIRNNKSWKILQTTVAQNNQ